MIRFRNYPSSFVLGAVVAAATITPGAEADETYGIAITQASARCASFGAGFVDMGGGTCSRVGGHVRVDLDGTHSANLDGWSTGTTSNAGLRTEGAGMLQGAADSRHLRVRSGLDSYNPFR